MTKLILLFVTVMVVYVSARHLHPHVDVDKTDFWENNSEAENESVPLSEEEDAVDVESIRNIKPSRFVPINNKVFFMGYLPCEDGFKRDIMGICREVWD